MRNLITALLLPVFFAASLPWQPAHALTSVDRAADPFNLNLLLNPGFENTLQYWTATGYTATQKTNSGDYLEGKVSAAMDTDTAGDSFVSSLVTVPESLWGNNGYASCKFQTASGTSTYTISVLDGSANVLVGPTTITSSTIATTSGVNFIYPNASGTVQIKIAAVAANEPEVVIDSCFLGGATNISNVSQASLFGATKIAGAASCSWTSISSSYAEPAADADCGTITNVGNAVTTDKQPEILFNSIPPGDYLVVLTVPLMGPGTNTATYDTRYKITDGTNDFGSMYSYSNNAATFFQGGGNQLIGRVRYTNAQGATTIAAQCISDGTRTCAFDNSSTNGNFEISVYRFPLESEQAFRPDVGPSFWSGYHDSTCASWSVTQASFTADFSNEASCALVERFNRNFGTVTTMAGVLPGIIFTPTRTGFYEICAYPTWTGATLAATVGFKLWDGTTGISERDAQVPVAGHGGTIPLCGLYNVTSTGAKTISIRGKASTGAVNITNLNGTSSIEWTVKAIDFSMNAPVLVGGVTNSGTGAIRIEAAKVNCDAGSSVTQLNGSTAFSSGNISTGACVVTIAAGTFSATPMCTATNTTGTAANADSMWISSASSTSLTVDCDNHDGTDCTAWDANLICVGAR